MSPDTSLVIVLSHHSLNWIGGLMVVAAFALVLTIAIWRNTRG